MVIVMPPLISNNTFFLMNTTNDGNGGSVSYDYPLLSNQNSLITNTTNNLTSDSTNTDISNETPILSNNTPILMNTPTNPNSDSDTTTPTVVSHTVELITEEKKVISKIVYSDGTEDVKELDLTDFYNSAYNEGYSAGVNSVDFSKTGYIIENGIIKVTTTLTNGKSQEYNITLDENLVVSLYNQIMANKSSCFQIRQNETEYSFLVESRQYQPQPNLAYQPAVDGTPVYEVLGQEQKTWSFTLYVDSIPKMQFLQQLASNPLIEVYFDEIGDWKQALIQSISLSRITTGHYYADIELIILE